MKRYISLTLAVISLLMCFSVPSYAAEYTWLNVLDYSTPNDSGSNSVVINSGDVIFFDLPDMQVGYIDFVVQLEYPYMPSCSVVHETGIQLECIRLNDYVYRFFGKIDSFFSDGISLVFNGFYGGSIQFLSFRISSSVYMSFNSPVSGYISFGNGEESSFYYNSSDDYQGVTIPGNSSFNYQDYRLYLNFTNWKNFDYIDLQFYASHLSLVSISASLAENSVPCEISYLSSDSTFEVYLVNLTLDLTEVNRDTSLPLELIITGSVPTLDSSIGHFSVLYCNGLVENSGLSESLSFWYRIKWLFSSWFNSLYSWINYQTSSISGTIAEWGQKIVQAINPDTGAADEVINQGSQAADQVTDLTGQMNSVVKPDLNGGGDISSIISPSDMSSYTVFLSTVVNAPYIGQVIMLSLILSLAGYVLFGKR